MPLAEPTTAITDFILAALCFYFADRLFAEFRARDQRSVRHWAGAIGAVGAAALLGGIWHGFHTALPEVVSDVIWLMTMLVTGGAAYFMLVAVFTASLERPWRQLASLFALGQLLAFTFQAVRQPEFVFVVIDYGLASVIVLGFMVYEWFGRKRAFAPWIIAAIAVSGAGAAVQMSGLALHRHFNHNDLYHVIQMLAMYLFFRGGLLLWDRENADSGTPVSMSL